MMSAIDFCAEVRAIRAIQRARRPHRDRAANRALTGALVSAGLPHALAKDTCMRMRHPERAARMDADAETRANGYDPVPTRGRRACAICGGHSWFRLCKACWEKSHPVPPERQKKD